MVLRRLVNVVASGDWKPNYCLLIPLLTPPIYRKLPCLIVLYRELKSKDFFLPGLKGILVLLKLEAESDIWIVESAS